MKTFFIGFQNWTKNKLELETLSTFHQITLDFVEKRGRPKSIAFCRKMWIFQGQFGKKMKIIFHDSIFDHDDDHCEKNPFWLL